MRRTRLFRFGSFFVSEPVIQRLKISREGVILIKSFEGFRPRAVRREDDRWVVGYGHTLSAREGATVSEAEAELLLQYDLVPIAKALNAVARPLNQNQFDALASFAFSVGLDRFQSSDVLDRLTSGASAEAADAMVGWADPLPVVSPAYRRTTERALFVTVPAGAAQPATLAERITSDTLSAPDAVAGTAPTSFADTSPAEAMVAETQASGASPQRYSAYAAGIVGPLPGPFPANLTLTTAVPVSDPAAGEASETASSEAASAPVPFQPVFSADTSVADAGQLQVQTPLDAGTTISTELPVAGEAETTDQTTLFDDRGALRPDARQMIRHEVAGDEPRKFDWREVGLYVVMSGFGLVTFGLAIAAFRTASKGAGRSDFTTIAWVLGVLGFACIAVSIWNLYRKLGRHEA